ncbi:MAG: hypothetical protein JWM85_934 [Acidimicrobiaceae bacterium]|nr:hypothetical protein [Acidimicrobiaceae bacterium]
MTLNSSKRALAGRLTERGLIERVPAPGRAVRHQLTVKGRELRRAADPILESVRAESFAVLTPAQLASFDKALAKLRSSPGDGEP